MARDMLPELRFPHREVLLAILLLFAAVLPALAQPSSGVAGGLEKRGVLPPPVTDEDYRPASSEQIELGRLLFFDKILSGNRDISCASCHHPMAHTSDGLSLPLGTATRGLSVMRDPGDQAAGVLERVPRNSPAIFNLGAFEFTTLFHDGRVAEEPAEPSGFLSPAGSDLPPGLDSPLAVQAMFPPTSATEMAGQPGENPIADAVAVEDLAGADGVWALLAERLQEIPEYVDLFREAFDDVEEAGDIRFVHAANAIAAFEGDAWRADDSPYDRLLRGDAQAMSRDARRGMLLFYGRAGCGSCHSGVFQTDHGFHSIGMVQVGPGKGDGIDGLEDLGRERVTGDPEDRYRFRTSSLRNIALTGPYGHAGAYRDLESVVRHHLDPPAALDAYDPSQVVLPSRPDLDELDLQVQEDPVRRAEIGQSSEVAGARLDDGEIRLLVEFLHALTDPASIDLRSDVPMQVPSGLPVAD